MPDEYTGFPPPERTTLELRTLRDDVRKELVQALRAYRTLLGYADRGVEITTGLREWQQKELAAHLTPLVCELIEHALQCDRVDRGVLPYDED